MVELLRYTLMLLLGCVIISSFINYRYLKSARQELLSNFKIVFWGWSLLALAILNVTKIESENLVVSNSFQIVMVAISSIIIAVAFLARLRESMAAMSLPLICLIVYGTFGLISSFYSPYPQLTLYKASLIIVSVLAGSIALSYRDKYYYARKLIELTILFIFLLVLTIVIGAIFAPEKAFTFRPGMKLGMLGGWLVVINPNGAALLAGLLALVSLNRLISTPGARKKLFLIALFCLSLSVMLLAQSRTVTAAFIPSAMLILLRNAPKTLVLVGLMGVLLVVGLSDELPIEEVGTYMMRGQTKQQWETWSGRLVAWQIAWERFKDAPIFGYGMAAGVRYGAIGKELIGSHLHNSYMEVLLNSGLLGFFPWFFSLFITAKKLLLQYVFPPITFTGEMKRFHTEMTAVIVLILIRSLAGTTLVYFEYFFMLFIGIIAYAASLRQIKGPGLAAV
jgi:O-antigen ligase